MKDRGDHMESVKRQMARNALKGMFNGRKTEATVKYIQRCSRVRQAPSPDHDLVVVLALAL